MLDRERKYRELAKKEYDEVIPLYEEVNSYCKPFVDTNEKLFTRNTPQINMFILEQVEGFTNYLMNSLIPRGVEWGKARLDENLIMLAQDEKSEAERQRAVDIVKQDLEKANMLLFENLNSSNYFDEVYNAMWDSITLGTGIFKIKETDSVVEPFVFKRITTHECYIMENKKGKIDRVSKVYEQYNFDMAVMEWGKKFKWQYNTNDPQQMFNFIEMVYPVGKKFKLVVMDEGLNKIFFEQVLDYNPYIVFRFRKHSISSYGVGQGLWCLDLFKELNKMEKLSKEQVEAVIKPPLIAYGDSKLFQNLMLGAGKINYGGIEEQPTSLRVKQAIPDYRYQVAETEINQLRDDVRRSFLTNPMGAIEDGKNMTATESQIRAEQFRNQFSGLYERLVIELLSPLFMNCLKIMNKKSIITLEQKYVDISKIVFSNAIAESYENQEVGKVINMLNVASNMLGFDARNSFVNKGKVREYLIDRLKCNVTPLNTDKEMLEAIEQEQQARREAIQQQVLMESIKRGGAPTNVDGSGM